MQSYRPRLLILKIVYSLVNNIFFCVIVWNQTWMSVLIDRALEEVHVSTLMVDITV